MIRRKLSQALAWASKTIREFLANLLQMIGAACVVMGGLLATLGVVLTVAMSTPGLAATVAPLLRDLAITMLPIIAVVIPVMLGFKNCRASFMDAEVNATMIADASESALDAHTNDQK